MKKAVFLLIIIFAAVNLFAQPPVVNSGEKADKRPPQIAQPRPQSSPENLVIEIANDDDIKVETNLVTIPVKVSDRGGRFIPNLKKENFTVLEDDVEQEIAYFSSIEQPFTVALILDMSPSTTFKISEIQAAANAFIARLRPKDKVMIVSFAAEVRVLAEPTNNRQLLKAAVKQAKIESGTSLYEAVDFVVNQKFKKIEGRKAVVLFSDGVDTTSIKADANSNLNDIYELDALIYPIEYNTYNDVQTMKGKPVTVNLQKNRILSASASGGQGTTVEDYRKAGEYLNELANRTSGRVYRADNTSNLAAAFSNIAAELRQTYSLGYYPSEGKTNAKRRLKVRVNQKGVVVRARDSYVAMKERRRSQ